MEIRGRVLSAGVGVEDDSEEAEPVEAAKSLLSAPQLPVLGVSTRLRLEFKPGVRFKFTLRCRFMLRSSPVAEGRLPKFMEFLVAFFPAVLRHTLAEFPSSDLQGVLRFSNAERD